MKDAYVGCYWTLPVKRKGFTSLPDDAEEAAKLSRTIRYQKELARRWAADNNGAVVREIVFMDKLSDRATDRVQGPLVKARRVCEKLGPSYFM
jgi:hypothetical protein